MLYAIVAVIALIFDQLIKYWTTIHIVVDTGEKPLIPGLVHLACVHNYGAAFSFLQGARWFFVVLCAVFVATVVYLLAKDIITSSGSRWAAVIVMAGAVGNAIDRVIAGYVVDMFEFEFIGFPVFNLADIYITLGAIAFCIFLLTEKPAQAGAARARAKKPARHKKTEIPTFPKREPRPAPPPMDPADPFAEWERMANAEPEKPVETPAPRSGPVIYTQPAAAEARMRAPLPKEPPRTEAPKPESAAAPVPETPKAPEAPKPAPGPTGDGISYDLDDILAEFKDL